MTIKDFTQLGEPFFCSADSPSKDWNVKTTDHFVLKHCIGGNADNLNDPTIAVLMYSDGTEGIMRSVYLRESQVDDLLVALMYWKENK